MYPSSCVCVSYVRAAIRWSADKVIMKTDGINTDQIRILLTVWYVLCVSRTCHEFLVSIHSVVCNPLCVWYAYVQAAVHYTSRPIGPSGRADARARRVGSLTYVFFFLSLLSVCFSVSSVHVRNKLSDSLVTHGPYLSALEIRSLYIKRYINPAVYLLYCI